MGYHFKPMNGTKSLQTQLLVLQRGTGSLVCCFWKCKLAQCFSGLSLFLIGNIVYTYRVLPDVLECVFILTEANQLTQPSPHKCLFYGEDIYKSTQQLPGAQQSIVNWDHHGVCGFPDLMFSGVILVDASSTTALSHIPSHYLFFILKQGFC